MKRRLALQAVVQSQRDIHETATRQPCLSPRRATLAMRPKKGPSPKDISVALEIEKKCLYFMSRETNTELANLKEEEARYERLVKLFQDQIDALETSPKQLARHTGITSDPCLDSVDHNTTLQK